MSMNKTINNFKNGWRSTYLICVLFWDVFLITIAIVAPIEITPNYYWWTAVCIILFMGTSTSLTMRLNQFNQIDEIKARITK